MANINVGQRIKVWVEPKDVQGNKAKPEGEVKFEVTGNGAEVEQFDESSAYITATSPGVVSVKATYQNRYDGKYANKTKETVAYGALNVMPEDEKKSPGGNDEVIFGSADAIPKDEKESPSARRKRLTEEESGTAQDAAESEDLNDPNNPNRGTLEVDPANQDPSGSTIPRGGAGEKTQTNQVNEP